MSDSKEKEIKNEIGEITKTINAILKKIEAEREKLLPPTIEEPASTIEDSPVKDDQTSDQAPPEIKPPDTSPDTM